MSRIAKVWEPMVGRLASDADLHEARAVAEQLQAQLSPPATPPTGCDIRAVTAGGVPSLIVAPAGISSATILFLHGGAYVLGTAFGYHAHAGALGVAAQAGVLVADYRLAPELPFPAAVEDAVKASLWLLERGASPNRSRSRGTRRAAASHCPCCSRSSSEARHSPAPLFCSARGSTSGSDTKSGIPHRRCRSTTRTTAPRSTSPTTPPTTPSSIRSQQTYAACHRSSFRTQAGMPDWPTRRRSPHTRAPGASAYDSSSYPVDAHGFHLFWSFLPDRAELPAARSAGCRSSTRTRAISASYRLAVEPADGARSATASATTGCLPGWVISRMKAPAASIASAASAGDAEGKASEGVCRAQTSRAGLG